MTAFELRPLSTGEILDRTFTLYRRYFLLFIGLSGIPQIFVLTASLLRIFLDPSLNRGIAQFSLTSLWMGLAALLITLVAYLFSQGATVFAVSELYLGRPASIASSIDEVWSEFGTILGVILLNGLVIFLGLICLIVPGIYLMCRLLVCVPVAMVEKRGGRESLERSFQLTRDDALRAFLILLLSIVITYAAAFLISTPLGVMVGVSRNDPSALRLWTAISQIGNSIAGVLISPILLIATSVYYFDLRVRKEAFDLQIMLNPDGTPAPPPMGPPSIIS